MCEKQEYTFLDKLLMELVILSVQLRTLRGVQRCFDEQLKTLRLCCPEVFQEILKANTEPEVETIDVDFEVINQTILLNYENNA